MKLDDFPILTRSKNSLRAAGFLTETDFEGKTEADLKAAGLGAKGIYELKEFLKFHFKIKIGRPKKKVLENVKECQLIVDHFLAGVPDINWPRELKNADRLIKTHGFDFLLKIPQPKGIYSLGYFFQDFGVKFLEQHAPIRLVEEKVAPKEVVEYPEVTWKSVEKPKTIKDFLGIKR